MAQRHRGSWIGRWAVALGASAVAALCGCGPSPITAARIQEALAPTFANLVHLELSRIGLTPVAAADIRVVVNCRRQVPGAEPQAGAGDWQCALDWHGPSQRGVRDMYEVTVGPDDCYAAHVDGGEGLGGPVVLGTDGKPVRNLLYAFEGCFETP